MMLHLRHFNHMYALSVSSNHPKQHLKKYLADNMFKHGLDKVKLVYAVAESPIYTGKMSILTHD